MSEMVLALAAIFVSAGVLLLVADSLNLPTIPFYIIAGFIAGEFIPQAEVLDLTQWGIAFLVFVFGVGIELPKLSSVFRDSELTAAAQLAVLGPVGFGVGVLLGFDLLNAFYFAIAATLSSTLVGTGLLEVEIRTNLVHGRLAKSIHLLDDFLAITLLLVLSASVFTADAVAAKIGYGVVIIMLALIIQRHLFEYLIRYAEGSQELMTIGAISLLIGFLTLAGFVGVSPVVGAFAAGLAVRRDDIRVLGMLNGIGSINDFFVVIFFVTLGALVTVPSLDVVVTAGVLAFLTAIVKPVVTLVALLWEGYDVRTATLTSVSLDQISEFALIIAIQALLIGRIEPALFDAIILAAALTMVTSSLSRRYDEWLFTTITGPLLGNRQTAKIDEQSSVIDSLDEHVAILGFGRIGRRLVQVCESAGVDYVVIENDPTMRPRLRAEAEQYVVGDAMYEYVWTKANIDEARLIISTVDQQRVSERILARDTQAEIVLRTADPDGVSALREAGAAFVIVPDLLASAQLEENVRRLLSGELSRETLAADHLAAIDKLEANQLSSLRDARS